MVASWSRVRVTMVSTIKVIDSVVHIGRGMRMDQVNNDFDSHRVSFVYKIFKVIRSSLSGRDGKEASDVISKTTIICMLLNCHELDDVIASFLYSWKDIICICSILKYTTSFVSHTNV